MDSVTRGYLKTLRRIPKAIRLSMATREFDMDARGLCICGWAIRESITHATGRQFDTGWWSIHGAGRDTALACARRFGGTRTEWTDVFIGVTDDALPAIEEAFTLALTEAL